MPDVDTEGASIRAWLALVLLTACTYGGSDENPRGDYVPVVLIMDSSMTPEAQLPEQPVADASVPVDSSVTPDGGVGRADGGVQMCKPAKPVAVCDPVHNTGCLLFLMQCDFDPAPTELSGRCVFGGISLDATCSSDELSTTCPAQQTCVKSACHKMCFCNADCDPGQCCTGQISGNKPLKFCQKC